MEQIKLIGDMYGILIELKKEYENTEQEIDFHLYVEYNLQDLKNKAIEWMADDVTEGIDND